MKCLKAQAHTWWIVVSNNADKFLYILRNVRGQRKQNPNVSRLAMDGSQRQLQYQHNHIQWFPRKINYYMRTLCILLNYISISKKKSRLKSNGRNGTGYAVHKLRMSDYEITLFSWTCKTRKTICLGKSWLLYLMVHTLCFMVVISSTFIWFFSPAHFSMAKIPKK